MCGIIAILGSTQDPQVLRKRALELSKKLRHRGPDWNGIAVQVLDQENQKPRVNVLTHERLGIVDPSGGAQPILNEDKSIALSINAEIYNHVQLESELQRQHNFGSKSDCEVVIHLYEEIGDKIVEKLDGMFSFVISNSKTGEYLAARDAIGITPLYIGWGRDGALWFASEMKALIQDCERFQEFPPGHYVSTSTGGVITRWYNASWTLEQIPTEKLDLERLRESLERAVVKRLMTDVPYGVLLSGGLDSSLVASIASRHAALRVEDSEKSPAWWPRLHSFSIGLPGSPDLAAAQIVADYLGTVHHSFHFTVEEGIDALSDVIYYLETYDVTTIRASTAMYFLARKIRAMGVKMVLSGEGADEIFGGYLYFHKAPSPEKFHVETCHKLKSLSKYDCLRANKSTMAWGLEVRVPFLDKSFLDVAMGIDPHFKMTQNNERKIEKYILRKAFDTPQKPYLPDSILWRQKEQFSDGVGYSWIDSLKKYAEQQVTDEMFKSASFRFPYNTPATKEAYYYRSLFHSHYPQEAAAQTVPGGPSVACSTPAAIEWEKSWSQNLDPSGRSVLGVHVESKETK